MEIGNSLPPITAHTNQYGLISKPTSVIYTLIALINMAETILEAHKYDFKI